MSRFSRLSGCVVIAFLGLLVIAPAADADILFWDDFQSDTAGTQPTTSNLNPVIGAGDIGGSWTIRENNGAHIQVLNDTVPANGIAGTNNYVETTRLSSNSAANSSRLHATGWDPAETANQLVQLDFSLYQTFNESTGGGNLTLNLYDAAPPGSNTDTGTTGAVALTNMDFAASIPDSQWVDVQLIFNTSDTLTLIGPGSVSYGPQTYSFTVDGGSFMDQAGNPVAVPQAFVLAGGVTQFQSIMFKEGNNFNNEYIDNVRLSNNIAIPEAKSLWVLLLVGLIVAIGWKQIREVICDRFAWR
ncbi:MAG: hypothetical protein WD468_00300 [Pirellulales bacterium]